jgi:hypothetical protein
MTADETYAALVEKFPHADRRDLIDALEAATAAATYAVVGKRLTVRMVLAGAAPEIVEAAELEVLAQRVTHEHAVAEAMRRAEAASAP